MVKVGKLSDKSLRSEIHGGDAAGQGQGSVIAEIEVGTDDWKCAAAAKAELHNVSNY
jgi:hypothetical protein